MKNVFRNYFVKSYKFEHNIEYEGFIAKINDITVINLDNTIGQYYYCYIFHHSLTMEKKFFITFCSDYDEDDLSLILNDNNYMFIHTGHSIFCIDQSLNIIANCDLSSRLIGTYHSDSSNFIILCELELVIINPFEKTIKSISFDDIVYDFSFNDHTLTINMDNAGILTFIV